MTAARRGRRPDHRLVPHPHLTRHGEIHLGLATVGFIAAAVGAVLVSTALRRGPWKATGASLTLAILSVVALLFFPVSAHIHHAGGLGERLFLAIGDVFQTEKVQARAFTFLCGKRVVSQQALQERQGTGLAQRVG